jgi:amino acid adenylation domain-containing protein/thioester reductase-like protein
LSGTAFLAAFIYQGLGASNELFQEYCSTRLIHRDALSLAVVGRVVDGMHKALPRYMVPKVYIPLTYMPLTTSGKIDRKKLQSIAAGLTARELVTYSGQHEEHSSPVTDKERRIAQVFAQVLNLQPDSISRYDNFIRLGGDSILAMKLVALAREEEGIQVTVADLFRSPVLHELAHQCTIVDQSTRHATEAIPAFALIGSQATLSSVMSNLSGCYTTGSRGVTDVYPCTPFQEGIMALSTSNPGTYVAQHVFKLSQELSAELARFRAAWDTVVAAHPILRTRIVQTELQGLVQVVSDEKILWKSHDDLEQFLRMDKSIPLGVGSTLNRHALVVQSTREGLVDTYFVWTMHHACYDGWSMRLTLQHVEEEYRRLPAPGSGSVARRKARGGDGVPFNRFVQSIQNLDLDGARRFWHAELGAGNPAATFPAITGGYVPRPNATMAYEIGWARKRDSDLQTPDLIRAAWAITLGSYAGSDDVVFGNTLSGRTGSVEDLPSIVGPTITTVPVRIRIEPQLSVLEYLRSVKAKMLDAMPFEQLGLSRIRSIDDKVKAACDFQNLLVVQPMDFSDIDHSFLGPRMRQFINADVFDTYALTMECSVAADRIRVNAIYDPIVIEEVQMRRVVRHFEHILLQLCSEDATKTIRDINTISPADARELQHWNAVVPEPMDACVHHQIEKRARENPAAPAICSWDGDLTRGELAQAVSRVARDLVQRGIGRGSKVPLLFHKSKWAMVATLAVVKAGGAFVPLDPQNPVPRLMSIVDQIDASVILCAAELGDLCSASFPGVKPVVIDQRTTRLSDEAVDLERESRADDDLYIIFTSGTTGTPKGTVIQHGAYCAGARDHARALRFDETSRFLQFASYSFDTSVEDILTTFMTGGCLCIPSEAERSADLVGAIARMNVNTADLTPSFISGIAPDEVPSLRRLILGGEPLTSKAIKTWADRVHLINGYGTTECCVTSLVNAEISGETSPANIGTAVGAVSWIVDVTDSSQLVPIGATGELLIEGPAIARGYLNDPQKTEAQFIDSVTWNTPLVRCAGRHYKTGDLVQYGVDGSINYVGRKDTRIKLRGQRVELGDIESHLLGHPDIRNALILLPAKGPYAGQITALVELECLSYAGKKQDVQMVPRSELSAAGFSWSQLSAHLRERVPSYMVPACWIAMEKMPLHTSGKLDRARLGAWLHGLSGDHQEQSESRGGSDGAQRILRDDTLAMDISRQLANIVRGELASSDDDDDDSIAGSDVKLAEIGIDSIKLMSLAAFIKRVYRVSVPMGLLIRQDTRVSDIAQHIRTSTTTNGTAAAAAPPDFSIDLHKEFSRLDAQVAASQEHIGVVFLTGATGYLGIQILRQLLEHPGVARVIVHVRARDAAEAGRRLEAAAQSARWSMAGFAARVETWTGDLAQAMLGLHGSQWSRLAGVDAIIHNGAWVNHLADYHTLKAANVNSTCEILRAMGMSRHQPPPKLVYVAGGRRLDETGDVTSKLTALAGVDGYSQTKFVSEALVQAFARRAAAAAGPLGQAAHITIVEPGLIMGTAHEGIAGTGDFVWRYVAGAVSIGAYPAPGPDDWLEISSVDRVAGTVMDRVRPGAAGVPGGKITVGDGLAMTDFWEAVNARVGHELWSVSAAEWMRMIQLDIQAKGATHALWPVAHLLDAAGNLGKGKRRSGGGVVCNTAALAATVGRNVDFLISSGFLTERERK